MNGDVAATYCATLVDEWARRGVTHAVVCPGSRSTPMAIALAAHGGVAVHVHHDERSAGFMAVGLGLATGRPAIVLTTSGTAAVELHPAVVEAHQANVAVIALTADRPPELQGVGAPQTIDQRRLFGGAVRWFVDPGPPQEQYRDGWRRLAADVVAASELGVPGPVHMNLAFREPLIGQVGDLPRWGTVDGPAETPRFGLLGEQVAALRAFTAAPRGVIVAGVRAAATTTDRDAILSLAERTGWPILADHLSAMRVDHPLVIATFDPMLREVVVATELRPDAVLRIGGLLASRVTNEWLAASGAHQVGVDRWGASPDPDRCLAASLRVDVGEACRQLCETVPARSPDGVSQWAGRWQTADAAARAAIASTIEGEPAVADAVVEGAGDGAVVVVSSSMPVRDLEWYVPRAHPGRIVSNRGANGIDGVTSTAVGVAGSGMRTVCLLGDVAFLHDTNGLLALAARGVDLAIVVVDNDGGGIFSFLPQAEALPGERFEQLFGTPHGVDLAGLARAHHLDVVSVADAEGVTAALAAWRSVGGTVVIVVTSDRVANVKVHRAMNEAVASAVRAVW